MPRTVEGDTVSHVYPQYSSWDSMGAATIRDRGGMKDKRKRGTMAIKEKETNEERTEKIERRENAAKLYPDHFQYK